MCLDQIPVVLLGEEEIQTQTMTQKDEHVRTEQEGPSASPGERPQKKLNLNNFDCDFKPPEL